MNLREKQKLETKQRIYDTAFKLFSESSFDQVKVTDIAKAAGVSVGGLYYHFETKEDILDYGYYKFDQLLKAYYEEKNPPLGIDGVRALIDYQVQTVIDMGSHLTSVTFKNQMEKKNTYLFSKDRYLDSQLLKNVKACHKEEAEHIVSLLLRTVRGTIYDWCTRNGDYDLKKVINEELNIIYSYYQIG